MSASFSCLETLGGGKEHRDLPRVAHEKAAPALLGRDAGFTDPADNRGDLLGVVEHHRPVAQTHPALRDGRYALAAPDVEAEVVMVAACRDERRGAGDECHELEAEHVAVEGESALQIANVQVHVADREAGSGLAAYLLAGYCGQQAVQIKGLRTAGVVQRPWPHLSRAVGGQLDAVTVRVGKVDRLVRTVVGGTLDRGPLRRQSQGRARQFLAGREQQRVVVEASVASGPPRTLLLVKDE